MTKEETKLSGTIAKSVSKLYNELGEGLLERIYAESLIYELEKNGLKVYRDKEMIVKYERISIKTFTTIDLLVNNKIVIMIKKKSEPEEIFKSKVQTLFRLSKYNSIVLLDFSILEQEYLVRGSNDYNYERDYLKEKN